MSTRGLRSPDIFMVTVIAMHTCRAMQVPRHPANPDRTLAESEVLCELNEKVDCKLSARALREYTNTQSYL